MNLYVFARALQKWDVETRDKRNYTSKLSCRKSIIQGTFSYWVNNFSLTIHYRLTFTCFIIHVKSTVCPNILVMVFETNKKALVGIKSLRSSAPVGIKISKRSTEHAFINRNLIAEEAG